jgi:CubicO group peptidase (beta-lactamase class C family)
MGNGERGTGRPATTGTGNRERSRGTGNTNSRFPVTVARSRFPQLSFSPFRVPRSLLPLLLLAGCSGADATPEYVPPPPPVKRAMAPTLDTALLGEAYARARELPRLRSMLVSWKGEIVGEQYYRGNTRSSRANIKSASKSVISALVGIAIAQGKIEGTSQPISELLRAETRALDSTKRAITVGDLLSMRAGLQSTSFDQYGSWVSSRNWVANALRRPMVADPGGPMIYSTGNTHLLSAIVTRNTGMSTYAFAQRHLMRPLGIELRPWQTDPQGIFFGGNDMYLTPREMLRFGALYLNGGKVGNRQVIPSQWIDSSWTERTVSPWNGHRYGYGWWTRTAQRHTVRFAWGYGGQYIFVVPELELIVVTTSDSEPLRGESPTWAVHRILEDQIIPSVLQN